MNLVYLFCQRCTTNHVLAMAAAAAAVDEARGMLSQRWQFRYHTRFLFHASVSIREIFLLRFASFRTKNLLPPSAAGSRKYFGWAKRGYYVV
jgi:hypothetical protein